jgi:hypothetical protein
MYLRCHNRRKNGKPHRYCSDFAGHVHLPNSSLTLPFGGPYHTSIVRLSN